MMDIDDEFANCGAGFGGMFRLLGKCVVRPHELDWRYVRPALRIHLKAGIRETFEAAVAHLFRIWLFFTRAMMRGSFHKRPMPPRKPSEPPRGLWGRARFDREFEQAWQKRFEKKRDRSR